MPQFLRAWSQASPSEVTILSQLPPWQLQPAWSEICINQLGVYFWLITVFNLSECNCSHPNIYSWIRAFSFLSIWLTSTHSPGPSSDFTPLRKTSWSLQCPNIAKVRGPSCVFPQTHTHLHHNAQDTDHNFWRLLFYLTVFINTSGQEACIIVFTCPVPT